MANEPDPTPAAPAEPEAPVTEASFTSSHTNTFPALLRELGISLLVSTYQAGKLIVVRAQGDESILPLDDQRRPIYQARISLKWEISEMLKAFIWVQYVRDNNATLVVTDPNEGTASLRVFQSPDTLGMAASLQARF